MSRFFLIFALLVLGACNDGSGSAETEDVSTEDRGLHEAGALREGGIDAEVEPSGPACSDFRDNDGDGLIDEQDPGCEGPDDDDEGEIPQCADGIDNDFDNLTDYPDDPGCGSAVDEDEFNAPITPQCNDGLDNDRDGVVDESDPGCASVADGDEGDENSENPTECWDGVDNDEDNIIDFPMEPGCAAAGDTSEADPPVAPACADGEDNDEDGRIDYPDDPGCASIGDRDELDKEVTPECSDGQDNDRDGKIDYPDDEGCEAASDFNERGSCRDVYDPPQALNGVPIFLDTSRGVFEARGSCGGRGSPESVVRYHLDKAVEALEISTRGATEVPTTLYMRRNYCLSRGAEVACQREEEYPEVPGHMLRIPHVNPGDYFIFVDGVAGIGGPVELTVYEIPMAECLNREDDDEDGLTDYPNDPGCESPDDRDETSLEPLPACFNDEDDDQDGEIDYPNDPGCLSASGQSEIDACGDGVPYQEYFEGEPYFDGDTSGEEASEAHEGSCGGDRGAEQLIYYHNPYNARLTLSSAHPQTQTPVTLYVRRTCDDPNSELGCDDGRRAGSDYGRIVLERGSPGDYWIIVDTSRGVGGPFRLSIEAERLDPACGDGRDNDGDGEVDADDPGCESLEDEDEAGEGNPEALCQNGIDDDDDGLIDYPYDPGCVAHGDFDEQDPVEPELAPACFNTLDDDEDGEIDFPWDPGCLNAADTDETDPRRDSQCHNRMDDDHDGLTDFPYDPGCHSFGDLREEGEGNSNCSNGEDDDGDGRIDYPFDPGCFAAGDNDESDPDPLPACSNGLNDDGEEDELIDFPYDPGCVSAAHESEENSRITPACFNGRDDDRDGRTDFPDDPGCQFAGDSDERNEGPTLPRCSDGVDNDADNFIDLEDLGCGGPEDDDETDPEDIPECANGVDDDEDGLVDWPEDPGCETRGDLLEGLFCREETELTLLSENGEVQAETQEGEPDLYSSNCGGAGAPERVYRYILTEAVDLQISVETGGSFPAVLSVRGDCESPLSSLGCAQGLQPELLIADAQPGEYFIMVDGGAPRGYRSLGAAINLIEEPEPFEIEHGFGNECLGWDSDGRSDAFDCFGILELERDGHVSAPLNLPESGSLEGAAGGYHFSVVSDFPDPRIWRLRLNAVDPHESRSINVKLSGGLGAGGNTLAEQGEHEGLPWLRITDGAERDIPSFHLALPGHDNELNQIEYRVRADGELEIRLEEVHLPVTFYALVTQHEATEIMPALLEDVELRDLIEPPFWGSFQLNVQEQ